MKKLTGLVIILAVLVLGGYYGMGMITEKTIKRNIEVINQSNGLFADIEVYHRGWFNSDAKIKWRMHVPERVVNNNSGQSETVPAQDYEMTMPIKIHHGPIIYANNQLRFGMGYAVSDIAIPEKYTTDFDNKFAKESTKPQLDLSIFVNYLNKSTLGLTLPTFKLISKDGKGQFDWMGLKSTTSISSGMQNVEGGMVLEGLTFNKEEAKVVLGKVTTDYNLHQTPGGLYLGDATFSLPTFDVDVKGTKMFELRDLQLSSDSDIDSGLFSMHFNMSLKSVMANGQNYGPGNFEMSLRNIDADVLAQINQEASKMQSGLEAESQKILMSMMPQIPKLFTKGAELEISELSVKLPQGNVEGNLLIALPKGDSNNPFEMIQKVKGNAKLKVPVAVVKQLVQQSVQQQMAKQPDMQQALIQQMQSAQPQTAGQAAAPTPTVEQLAAMQTDKQLAAVEQTGLVTVSGSDYVIEVNLEQGKFVVNGKPFDPSMVKF